MVRISWAEFAVKFWKYVLAVLSRSFLLLVSQIDFLGSSDSAPLVPYSLTGSKFISVNHIYFSLSRPAKGHCRHFRDSYLFRRCQILFQAVPRKRFNDVVAKNGVGLAFASMAMSSFMDGPADGSGLTAVGETRLMPDLSTKRIIPWYLVYFLRQFSDFSQFQLVLQVIL